MPLSDLQIGLLSLITDSARGVSMEEIREMVSNEMAALIASGHVVEQEGRLLQRAYEKPTPPVIRETLTEPIHRRSPRSSFAYDVKSWRTDSERALKEWYKKEAAARGLDWREQYRAHKERMKELKKPPGQRRA